MKCSLDRHSSMWRLWACAPLLGLCGCSTLGIYRFDKPERAPAGEAVEIPSQLEGGVKLTGPMMAALKVAMDDFRPPWMKPEAQDTVEEKCLADWRYIEARVVQANDDLFYVTFSPNLSACGPGLVLLDGGAVYAIDGKGRILAEGE
ncbi:hypothetical protein [Myxococcus sp. Y35]|uniref:hypothetical protein n=1 Tax=Pseudomyxococcus flavus TaxID=3115648 RepID=UPI003CF321C1